VAAALGLDPATIVDLSLSLNPVAPDPVPIVSRYWQSIRAYPDPAPAVAALAEALGIDPERVLLTNGGAEAISLVSAEIGGSVVEPEFGLHPRGSGPRWRSNPNNPTGLLAPSDAMAEVWDEAFYPLATGQWTRRDAASVVVGSLTKLFACPGLRVGYVLGEPELISRLRRRQPSWAVNSLAATSLPDFLERADLGRWCKAVNGLRAELTTVLERHGLSCRPSDANWVLVDAPGLRARLARFGVVVRDCASFGLPDTARVAVPGPDDLRRLDEALARAVQPSCTAAGSVKTQED
jgi:histidinol-phosphate/aromatic aminotransferase/cobyric acid decarboxylase-like protein